MSRQVASCGRCDRRWCSMVNHHCTVCHCQFREIAGFDKHRVRGKCVPPKAGTIFRRSTDEEGNRLWILK